VLNVRVDAERFKNWNPDCKRFEHFTQSFKVMVGRSAHDIRLVSQLNLHDYS
jgi:predicted component of type VI protein secretion system